MRAIMSSDTNETDSVEKPTAQPHTDADSDSPEPPEDVELKDRSGYWDDFLAFLIMASPIILLLLGAVSATFLILTGQLSFDAVIGGTLDAGETFSPLLTFLQYGAIIVWVLATLKWFGAAPVMKIGQFVYEAMVDFGGGDGNE